MIETMRNWFRREPDSAESRIQALKDRADDLESRLDSTIGLLDERVGELREARDIILQQREEIDAANSEKRVLERVIETQDKSMKALDAGYERRVAVETMQSTLATTREAEVA